MNYPVKGQYAWLSAADGYVLYIENFQSVFIKVTFLLTRFTFFPFLGRVITVPGDVTKVTRVIQGEPTITKVTRVIEGAPSVTKVTRVIEGQPSITKVTRVIEGQPSMTKVTRVIEGDSSMTRFIEGPEYSVTSSTDMELYDFGEDSEGVTTFIQEGTRRVPQRRVQGGVRRRT
ncbi:periostin, osteoblast specific factor b [Danio aesculapii]|uniref:periostin, osteoblast specific factor b n=1 Tax=Danio aesculapii TaxID=1142201 RepID=UPI0024C039C8|nr:periostin, osteoblast specific factor b [Danio aesculapii]